MGIDGGIASLAGGASPAVVFGVALLLGLRHATDPDHLVAVSTLLAGDEPDRVRRAAALGGAWGAGHAATLVGLGLPLVLWGRGLPSGLQAAAEAAVGLIIVVLAGRLLLAWRRGRFHAHAHVHGAVVHRHLHAHAAAAHAHHHRPLRSPAQAFGIGLVHGAGGSAAVGLLLLASIGSRPEAAAALVLFALAAAGSMAALSCGLGAALGRAGARPRLQRLMPALGGVGLAFGAAYLVAALPLGG